MARFTEDELRDVVSGYEASKKAALMRRDARLREFHARGWRPVDLQRATGYSRETIRQALNPDVRQATNTGRRKPTAARRTPSAAAPPVVSHAPSPVGSHAPSPIAHAPSLVAHASAVASRAPGRPSYGDRKPYVVAESLDDLRGPTAGTVTLPAHLDWSGSASYDLDKPARLASMYRTVLNEAGSIDDLRAWLDGGALKRLWSTLWLPAQVRRLWESRFPELTSVPALAR